MDDEGFDAFACAELDGLLRYATVLTGDRELARDLVQDVLHKVYLRRALIDTAHTCGPCRQRCPGVTGGARTVFIAQPPAGIRTGFIALNATESAAAARAGGENGNPARPYYLIVSIPADNPPAVLVSILRHFPLPH